ncbi:MAG: OmpA family protein [Gammaproteobacteria bacterium]|nr:OmpA family protein [Gammaproteobacteria bacterium]NIP89144.1 OmpA family protein [Gammaproteobacteria bacterium]NIR24003.1 OmpA family protein [Gammaproteobacteria bacterium]NIS05638.1 OmpA family protein [Gammaproteobacteria bacterium]NIU40952.1 OmpA family protein [Gammaproteobacteria bacterium]
MSRFMIVPCLVLMLGIRMPMADEARTNEGTLDGVKGFGIGALVGGLVGGPVGALVGAAGGAFFAEQDAAKDRSIDELEVKLDERTSELVMLKSDLNQTQLAMTGEAAIIDRHADVPLSLAVYFRTGNADVESSLISHLDRLGAYLKAYPELQVRLEGYSDRRGDVDYNLALSQRRIDAIRRILETHGIAADRIREQAWGESRAAAQDGDTDAMIFDRAVIISIGDSRSTRA